MAMMTARGEASQNHAPAVEVWRGSLSWTWREPLPWVWRDALPRCGGGMARPLPWTSREPLPWVWRDALPQYVSGHLQLKSRELHMQRQESTNARTCTSSLREAAYWYRTPSPEPAPAAEQTHRAGQSERARLPTHVDVVRAPPGRRLTA